MKHSQCENAEVLRDKQLTNKSVYDKSVRHSDEHVLTVPRLVSFGVTLGEIQIT
jgi:hypothetical protein